MWTLDFWKALLERAIRAGAAAVVSVWFVGGVATDLLTLNFTEGLGFFLGGAIFSALTSLAAGTLNPATGVSLIGAEVPAGKPKLAT